MNLVSRIEEMEPATLVGVHLEMSLIQNRTGELWRAFMPRRKELLYAKSSDLCSLQLYPANYFHNFNPATPFGKWAGSLVSSTEEIPEGMEVLQWNGGKYAVFEYRGLAGASEVFQHIFRVWLPASGYVLDHRPHFEVLGEKYNNVNDQSEEEIWIPVM
jgi:AraC family transcriptional regulator